MTDKYPMMKKQEIQTEEGLWRIRKPTARELLVAGVGKESATEAENYETMRRVLQKCIVSGPGDYRNEDGSWDVDSLPSDTFLQLFFASCGSTLQLLQDESGW